MSERITVTALALESGELTLERRWFCDNGYAPLDCKLYRVPQCVSCGERWVEVKEVEDAD